MYCQVWWPILEIGALHLTHPSAHTHKWVVNTHPEQWAAIAPAPGEQLGVRCLAPRAPQSWYWRWRECCSFTIPTFNPCRTWDSNPQPLDYKSDSLTIRPRLPPWLQTSVLHLPLHCKEVDVCLQTVRRCTSFWMVAGVELWGLTDNLMIQWRYKV